MPWVENDNELQAVFKNLGDASTVDWASIAQSKAPSKWLWTDKTVSTKAVRMVGLGHIALRMELGNLESSKPLLALARRIIKTNAITSPQRMIQVHIEWPVPAGTSADNVEYGFSVATAIGARSLTLTGPHADRFRKRAIHTNRAILGDVFIG